MKFWLLIFWMIATLFLTVTIVGMFIFIANYKRSTWMQMGYDLVRMESDKTINSLLYLIWMIFTLIFTVSIVGMFLFIKPDYSDFQRSTWFEIGKILKDFITNNPKIN